MDSLSIASTVKQLHRSTELCHIPMSEGQDDLISSLYPPPPPYIKFFTNENINKVEQLIKQGESIDKISETKDLRFLIPPKQPQRPSYRSFGDVWNFEDKFITLKESGITQLYDDSIPKEGDQEEENEEIFTQERIEELKKMTKSLLLNFLEFIGLVAKNPTLAFEKIEQIRTILINLHHLLNSYRLHQSREGLILKFEEKINEDQATIDRIQQTCDNVESKIKMLLTDEVPDISPLSSSSNDNENKLSSNISNSNELGEEESTSLDNKDIEKLKKEAIKSIIKSI